MNHPAPAENMRMHMKSAGLTDMGRVRSNNEDTFIIDRELLVVADGMGGAAAGEVASALAVKAISSALTGSLPDSDGETLDRLRQAIGEADEQIRSAAAKNRDLKGMGTTVVAALHLGNRLLIIYVGDSRAYIISGGGDRSIRTTPSKVDACAQTVVLKKIDDSIECSSSGLIRRITDDHSVVMNLVHAGVITEEEIRTHPLRNRITKCIGSLGSNEPDFLWYDIRDGDVLILCSDGLWEMVHEDLICAVVKSSRDPEEICRKLVSAANDAGGQDNITVITAMFSA